MARNRNRRQRNKVIADLEITQIATEGRGLARHNGKVVFVDRAVPGDVVDALITKKKKDFAIGKVVEIKTASPLRKAPFCAHFEDCGGCKWQFIDYAQQLLYKQTIVTETIQRIGKVDFPTPLPIVASERTEYYRNKMDFTCSNHRWLSVKEVSSDAQELSRDAIGLHVPGKFDRVVDIDHCFLQGEPSNELRNALRSYALEHQLSFYDVITHQGFLRNLIIRTSTLNELMVILSVGYEDATVLNPLLDFLIKQFPQITSLHYVINTKFNDVLYDLDVITYHGPGYIYEQFENIKYKISPKSFFQTNPYQALKLYQLVRSFADLKPEDILYDLYTGTGSIALFMANQCAKVVGIEEVEAAIVDAKFNAELNNIDNAQFYANDVKDLLSADFVATHGQPDVLITDPPRAGMHKDVVDQILAIAPKRIVYVSCNPATQARDLQLLAEKYDISYLQPVDMFPHTYHIENIAVLNLR